MTVSFWNEREYRSSWTANCGFLQHGLPLTVVFGEKMSSSFTLTLSTTTAISTSSSSSSSSSYLEIVHDKWNKRAVKGHLRSFLLHFPVHFCFECSICQFSFLQLTLKIGNDFFQFNLSLNIFFLNSKQIN